MENKNSQSNWEKFNVWMYNFLSAVLPYSTPLPIAILTARSARTFLELDPYTAGVLVFGLEGLGLLCTSLLVDAVVQWIRSRNIKSFAPVILFGAIVYVYVRILISLNVTLKLATGNNNPELSTVITLLCYVPLISGVINGWNKLRIDDKKKSEDDKFHAETREDKLRRERLEEEDRIRREQMEFHKEKLRIEEENKTARTRATVDAKTRLAEFTYQQNVNAVNSQAPTQTPPTVNTNSHSTLQKRKKVNASKLVKDFCEQFVNEENRLPTVNDVRNSYPEFGKTNVHYALQAFIEENAEQLIARGLVTQNEVATAQATMAKRRKPAS